MENITITLSQAELKSVYKAIIRLMADDERDMKAAAQFPDSEILKNHGDCAAARRNDLRAVYSRVLSGLTADQIVDILAD